MKRKISVLICASFLVAGGAYTAQLHRIVKLQQQDITLRTEQITELNTLNTTLKDCAMRGDDITDTCAELIYPEVYDEGYVGKSWDEVHRVGAK